MSPLTARDLMNPEVLGVRDDWPLSQLCAFLTEHQIHGAPVVDARGRFVGAVSTSDVAEEFAQGRELDWVEAGSPEDERSDDNLSDPPPADELTQLAVRGDEPLVRDIMTPTLFTVDENAPIEAIAGAMLAGRVHRLFVEREGRVIGIVTAHDLLKALIPAIAAHHPSPPVHGA